MEEGLIHHKQQAFQMLSSALLECKREDALFLSGVLKACCDFREEVRLQALSLSQSFANCNKRPGTNNGSPFSSCPVAFI